MAHSNPSAVAEEQNLIGAMKRLQRDVLLVENLKPPVLSQAHKSLGADFSTPSALRSFSTSSTSHMTAATAKASAAAAAAASGSAHMYSTQHDSSPSSSLAAVAAGTAVVAANAGADGAADDAFDSFGQQPCPASLRLMVEYCRDTIAENLAVAAVSGLKECLRGVYQSRALLDRLLKEAPALGEFREGHSRVTDSAAFDGMAALSTSAAAAAGGGANGFASFTSQSYSAPKGSPSPLSSASYGRRAPQQRDGDASASSAPASPQQQQAAARLATTAQLQRYMHEFRKETLNFPSVHFVESNETGKVSPRLLMPPSSSSLSTSAAAVGIGGVPSDPYASLAYGTSASASGGGAKPSLFEVFEQQQREQRERERAMLLSQRGGGGPSTMVGVGVGAEGAEDIGGGNAAGCNSNSTSVRTGVPPSPRMTAFSASARGHGRTAFGNGANMLTSTASGGGFSVGSGVGGMLQSTAGATWGGGASGVNALPPMHPLGPCPSSEEMQLFLSWLRQRTERMDSHCQTDETVAKMVPAEAHAAALDEIRKLSSDLRSTERASADSAAEIAHLRAAVMGRAGAVTHLRQTLFKECATLKNQLSALSHEFAVAGGDVRKVIENSNAYAAAITQYQREVAAMAGGPPHARGRQQIQAQGGVAAIPSSSAVTATTSGGASFRLQRTANNTQQPPPPNNGSRSTTPRGGLLAAAGPNTSQTPNTLLLGDIINGSGSGIGHRPSIGAGGGIGSGPLSMSPSGLATPAGGASAPPPIGVRNPSLSLNHFMTTTNTTATIGGGGGFHPAASSGIGGGNNISSSSVGLAHSRGGGASPGAEPTTPRGGANVSPITHALAFGSGGAAVPRPPTSASQHHHNSTNIMAATNTNNASGDDFSATTATGIHPQQPYVRLQQNSIALHAGTTSARGGGGGGAKAAFGGLTVNTIFSLLDAVMLGVEEGLVLRGGPNALAATVGPSLEGGGGTAKQTANNGTGATARSPVPPMVATAIGGGRRTTAGALGVSARTISPSPHQSPLRGGGGGLLRNGAGSSSMAAIHHTATNRSESILVPQSTEEGGAADTTAVWGAGTSVKGAPLNRSYSSSSAALVAAAATASGGGPSDSHSGSGSPNHSLIVGGGGNTCTHNPSSATSAAAQLAALTAINRAAVGISSSNGTISTAAATADPYTSSLLYHQQSGGGACTDDNGGALSPFFVEMPERRAVRLQDELKSREAQWKRELIELRQRQKLQLARREREIDRLKEATNVEKMQENISATVTLAKEELLRMREGVEATMDGWRQEFQLFSSQITAVVIEMVREVKESRKALGVHNATLDLIRAACELFLPMLNKEYALGVHPCAPSPAGGGGAVVSSSPIGGLPFVDPLWQHVTAHHGPEAAAELRHEIQRLQQLFLHLQKHCLLAQQLPVRGRPSHGVLMQRLGSLLLRSQQCSQDMAVQIRDILELEQFHSRELAKFTFRLVSVTFRQQAIITRCKAALLEAGLGGADGGAAMGALPCAGAVSRLSARLASCRNVRAAVVKLRVENAKRLWAIWEQNDIDVYNLNVPSAATPTPEGGLPANAVGGGGSPTASAIAMARRGGGLLLRKDAAMAAAQLQRHITLHGPLILGLVAPSLTFTAPPPSDSTATNGRHGNINSANGVGGGSYRGSTTTISASTALNTSAATSMATVGGGGGGGGGGDSRLVLEMAKDNLYHAAMEEALERPSMA